MADFGSPDIDADANQECDDRDVLPLERFLVPSVSRRGRIQESDLRSLGVEVVHGLHRMPPAERLKEISESGTSLLLLLSDEKLRHRSSLYGSRVRIVREYYKPG